MRFRGGGVGHRSTISCNTVLRREVPAASSVQWETEDEGSIDSGGTERADEEEQNSDDEEGQETDDEDSDPDSDDEFYNVGSEEEYRDEDALSDGGFGAL